MLRALAFLLLGVACTERAPDAGRIESVALPERGASPGTRFAQLDPAATGLRFRNELRRENVIAYVYSGAGVAVGDYDQDGLPDVYLVNQDGPNALFRQVAPLRFVDVTASAGGLDGGDAWGKAATFADVDGDGDLDLYVCNTEAPNLLYRNGGDGTFRECAKELGLALTAACTGAAFADYDRDGDLDLYLLTNRVFGPVLPRELVDEVTLPKDTRKTRDEMLPPEQFPEFAARDGEAAVPAAYEGFFDIVQGRVFAAGQQDCLLRNDGARFTDVTADAGVEHHGNGLAVTWWDCDDDGNLDLYVANDLHSPDKLWRNRGDGTFEDWTQRALPHTAFFGMGCDFGDIDNDGRFDLCVADMASTTHYMGKMLMGSMGTHRWFLEHADPPQYMRNAVYVNTGTGRFLEAGWLTGLASTDWTWSVRFCDLDEDGRVDFHATNGIPVFEDNPDTVAEFKRLSRLGRKDEALQLARGMHRVDERNVARRNLGDLQFQDVGSEWGLDDLGVSHGAAFSDLDRDGDLDLVVNNLNRDDDRDGDLDLVVNNLNRDASVLENRTSATHRVLVELRGRDGNRFGVGSRLTLVAGGLLQTRLLSPTRGYMSADEPVEHFGLGDAARIERLTVRWPSGRVQEFTDLAADHRYTIHEPATAVPPGPGSASAGTASPTTGGPVPATAAPNPAPPWFTAGAALPARHVERVFDDYAVQPLLPHRLSRLGPGLACGDADGDGRDDLWLGGAAGQPGTLLLARGGGRFEPVPGPWADDAAAEDMGAVFLDHDRDGDLDLYVASGGIEAIAAPELLQDRLYENDGRGTFRRAPAGVLPDLRRSSGPVCAADFDRDGDVDLFVGSRVTPGRFPESPSSCLLRNEDGRFVDATAELAPDLAAAGMVTAAVWTDRDGDGFPDLVVAAQWQPLRLWANDGGRVLRDVTKEVGLDAASGQWNGVAAADLDGDGDTDLVATNLGLNTKYKADRQKPQRLYAADFDGNAQFDVVEAKHAEGKLLPVRGLSCSSEAMPFLLQRFPTYDSFARATLTDIYGAAALQQSIGLACDELRHLVFEQKDGRFVARALPRRAQIAPGFGIGIADFDGDRRLDLALAQNSFSPEPETGRFDGGLGAVLRGGEGLGFAVVPPLDAGVAVRGDQKALCVLDLDGDAAPDFVVAINNGPLLPFRCARNGPALAVRLRGPAGNPTGIGARIELVAADGSRQVRELQAGGGYLSQSAPCAFFAAVPPGSTLAVRWPDGVATEHAVQPGGGTQVLVR